MYHRTLKTVGHSDHFIDRKKATLSVNTTAIAIAHQPSGNPGTGSHVANTGDAYVVTNN